MASVSALGLHLQTKTALIMSFQASHLSKLIYNRQVLHTGSSSVKEKAASLTQQWAPE